MALHFIEHSGLCNSECDYWKCPDMCLALRMKTCEEIEPSSAQSDLQIAPRKPQQYRRKSPSTTEFGLSSGKVEKGPH